MEQGMRLLLLGAAMLLAACGNTGRVAGVAAAGLSTAGSLAVGAASAVGSAASFVAGAGVQAVGAAGSAAAGALTGSAAAAPEVAAPAAMASAEPGLAAGTVAATAGGGAPALEVAAAAGVAAASLAGLEILHQAGRDGTYRAGELLSDQRPPADRCALQVFLGVAGEFGFAQGARFAVWLGERVREERERNAFAGMLMLAESMARDIADAAREARLAAGGLIGFEDDETMRHTLAVANDMRARCPAGAAGQLAKLLTQTEEETPAT
jgi:hypothetical protein